MLRRAVILFARHGINICGHKLPDRIGSRWWQTTKQEDVVVFNYHGSSVHLPYCCRQEPYSKHWIWDFGWSQHPPEPEDLLPMRSNTKIQRCNGLESWQPPAKHFLSLRQLTSSFGHPSTYAIRQVSLIADNLHIPASVSHCATPQVSMDTVRTPSLQRRWHLNFCNYALLPSSTLSARYEGKIDLHICSLKEACANAKSKDFEATKVLLWFWWQHQCFEICLIILSVSVKNGFPTKDRDAQSVLSLILILAANSYWTRQSNVAQLASRRPVDANSKIQWILVDIKVLVERINLRNKKRLEIKETGYDNVNAIYNHPPVPRKTLSIWEKIACSLSLWY